MAKVDICGVVGRLIDRSINYPPSVFGVVDRLSTPCTSLGVEGTLILRIIAEVVSLYGYYLWLTPYFISSPRAVPLE